MPRQERRRAITALVTIVFTIFSLVAPLVAMAIAQSEPEINLWNPSDFAGTRNDNPSGEEPPPVVSDAPTGNDEDASPNENTYRLMATSRNTPSTAVVEFEIDVGIPGGAINPVTIGEGTRIGNDAWELDWDIPPTINDGQYTLRAILYSGSGLTAIEVDRDEETVTVRTGNPTPATRAPAADITYPVNGGQVGFYVNPDSGSTNTILQAEFSAGTTFIEALYTVSEPGVDPVWKSCAGPSRVGTSDAAPAGQIQMRCVLQSADQGGQSVTGLAVVSNESGTRGQPAPNTYNASLNTAGDSIRIFPYGQFANSVTFDQASVRTDSTGTASSCSTAMFVTVLDQLGNPIADMNVDAHAQGPTDQLKFAVSGFFGDTPPSGNKEPDKGHSGTEPGFSCRDDFQDFNGSQGEHNVPGFADIKHTESTVNSSSQGGGANTLNSGRWGFRMWSDRPGETQVIVWADEDNDDQYCDDEPAAAGSLGWGVPAPAPAGFTPSVTDCPIPAPPPPPGGSTSPSSPSNGNGGTDCTITGTAGDDNIVGTQGNDVICAGDGDDQVDGRAGNDIIRGEDGDDILDGDLGNDTIDAGEGDDRAEGRDGDDLLDGFSGVDVLNGGEGNDTLRGHQAVDGLQGGPGRDVIQAGSGDDVVDAQGGRDILRGSKGEDILRGGGGPDTIKGMKQGDQLTGGGGPDKIYGGPGRDQCSGGGGRDRIKQCET